MTPPISKTSVSDVHKKILNNWAKLFSGSTAGAALGMLATIFMTRTIGVSDVGIFAIIQTFWRTLEGFLSFQSFQVLIKNGSDILHGQSGGSFQALIKICILADVLMALFGAALGMGSILAFHQRLNIPTSILPFAVLGAMTMMTMVTGAHLGILRLFDRFNIVATRDVVVGLLRVMSNGCALLAGSGIRTFICIWIVTEAIGNLLIVYYGFRELRVRGYKNIFRSSLRDDPTIKIASIVKALFTINFATMIRVLTEEGDTLLVNFFTGTMGAGEYKIAKNFSGIVYKFAGPLAQSVYPELAKAVSERHKAKFNSIMLHTSMQGGAIGIIALAGWAVLGSWLINITVGASYQEALKPILIITCGYAIGFWGIGITSAFFAFNKLNQYLTTTILCTLSYFIVALTLLPLIGMNGSAYGQATCYVVGLLISVLIVYKSYRNYNWLEE